MSGWFWISNAGSVDARLARFNERFAVSGVPRPSVCALPAASGSMHGWMWKEAPDWPDVSVATDRDSGTTLLLDGYVSSAGRFGSPPADAVAADWLLALWQAHEEALLPELNGSFGLCLVDARNGATTIVTDRWGSRPQWYGIDAGTLLIGNFTSAVAALFNGPLYLDRAAFWSLLAGNRPVANRSLYSEITRVGSGSVVRIDTVGNVRESRWFDLQFRPDHSVGVAEWGERIADALKRSAGNIKGLGPANLFLSGGLDSRIAAGALDSGFRSTSIITRKNLSSDIAERVADRVGADHTTLLRDDRWYLNSFAAAALISGGNYNVHHAHFFQAISRLNTRAQEHFLLGDLAENFNENYWKIDEKVARAMVSGQVVEHYASLDKYSHKYPDRLNRLFAPGVAADSRKSWEGAYRPVVDACFSVSDDPRDSLNALFRWYDNVFCPTNLMLECVRPVAGHANLMFDNSLLEILQTVPADIKSRGVLHKAVLRALDPGLLWIPNSNFWLPPAFPAWAEKLNRDLRRSLRPLKSRLTPARPQGASPVPASSKGSWHLMHQWYWNDEAHRTFLHELIEDQAALPDELFNRQALRDSVSAFESGDISRHYDLYPLISFGLLQRQLPVAGIR